MFLIRRIALFAAVLSLSVPGALAAQAVSAGANGGVEPPVTITADKMEYFSEKNVVIFTGNALAVRGDVTLSSSRMEVTLSESAEKDSSTVRRIVADENVSFRQLDPVTGHERFATGEKGEYSAEDRTVVLTGNPRIWEGRNVITGNDMVFYVDEHRFVVEGKKGRPVGLTVYPDKERTGKEEE